MARLERVRLSFAGCRGPFRYADFVWLIKKLGYEEVKTGGKTGGSMRRFTHSETRHLIMLHEPHDGEMGREMVRRLQQALREKNLI